MAEKKTPEQQEQERAGLLAHEDDLLRGLLAAAEDEEEAVEIEIARKGEVVLRFRIRPLRDHEYEECREKATTYHKNQFGVRVPKDTDPTKFRALLIYKATVDEDRERLWKNKAAWERLGVLSGPDLIARVLRAGEMAAIVEKIDEISGYGAELERRREELAKN